MVNPQEKVRADLREENERLCAQVAALQAKVDALMLEFCPDEMNEEQLENWARHQRPAPGANLQLGGPVKEAERAANIRLIRLIEEAPYIFDVLCKAHDLSLDGKHEEARDWMRAAIDAVEQERLPENY